MRALATIPILRIFHRAKALEFYQDYLGFELAWEHRFEPDMPVYMEVSRGGLRLHLSEHHGDGTPGTIVHVAVEGLDRLHRELAAKQYSRLRPGIGNTPWGSRCMELTDPFGNQLRLDERIEDEKPGA